MADLKKSVKALQKRIDNISEFIDDNEKDTDPIMLTILEQLHIARNAIYSAMKMIGEVNEK